MQKLNYILILILLVVSCKKPTVKTEKIELSLPEKIANAHGFKKWNDVKEVGFTFNDKRSWLWKIKSNEVTLVRDSSQISFNRKAIDSSKISIDRAFTNDKFWMLLPFQLVWDNNASISGPNRVLAPISGDSINKITITYAKNGGYTPGDAYDIFYDDSYKIREWIFRKGNREAPSLITTFENYQDFEGIKIALDHNDRNGNAVVNLSKIHVKTSN